MNERGIMSLEDIRKHNMELVVKTALICFVENGIEKTKISEIAKATELSERSIYRYFETKADLVLATVLLFWEKTVAHSQKAYEKSNMANEKGSVQIYMILKAYAEQYFTNRAELAFIQEAKAYLYRTKMIELISNEPPLEFNEGEAPLKKAIVQGVKDGTLKNTDNIEILYYNAFDSLLGLIQNMATSADVSPGMKLDQRKRIDIYCEMLTNAFCENR